MLAIAHLPVSSMFAVPSWLAWSLTIGGLGLSAVLSGWLQKHPKVEKCVTALALATVLALSLAAAHRQAVGHREGVTIAWPPSCDGGWYYVDFTCWFSV